MNCNGKYTVQELSEYIRLGEPGKQRRGEAWKAAIGLQQVDGLQPSEYLLETAKKHIDGEIEIGEVRRLIDTYYKSASARAAVESDRTEEADKVSARIAGLLGEDGFSFSPAQLLSIHRHLFEDIYSLAGQIRNYNISKEEWVLGGKSVIYASADSIRPTLDYDLAQEHAFDYFRQPTAETIRHLSRFCANLWQIHPFCEGNTRTVAVFMIKYLRSLGFNASNDVFAQNSWYFRNALVRANYNDLPNGIRETTFFLEKFFRTMLLGEKHDLRNRTLHIAWQPAESETLHEEAPAFYRHASTLASGNCTMEETALLQIIESNPFATQKQIASLLGKSERTVKTLTVALQKKGLLKRVNGKRNGYWQRII